MDPKFDFFNVTDVTYKTLDDHPFKVAVLVPKDIDAFKRAPVLVKFHGGGMVFGRGCMLHGGLRGEFEEYTRSLILHVCLNHKSWRETHVPKVPSSNHSPTSPRRLLHLATTAHAIIISPDYRHIPESTISDILADVQDFFTWLHASFPTALAAIHPHLTPALDKIAMAGESAGGYITLLAALLLPDPLTRLALAIPQYGAIDLTDAVWTAPPDGAPQPPRTLMGTEPPDPSFVDERLRAARSSRSAGSRRGGA
ncbi:hypothetical protein GTA08_BOTSDO00111 [Botryosphaeria dothidea]|uniref:Alpha/beta hydrolase fold-3 domain-containing protein n=1 Tax=Botryosphaeria dothidea TaxID=55169 RepID=A0A8H4J5N3_9PEZI|nr:hypothetical protein GTA08_BOTSDO00111 [Botryosphaeria dothidea]